MSDRWHKKQDDGQGKRLLWAVAISGLILIGFETLAPMFGLKAPVPEKVVAEVAKMEAEGVQSVPPTGTESVPGVAPLAAEVAATAETADVARTPVEVVLENDVVRAVVDASGGRMVEWTLKQHGVVVDDKDGYAMLKEEGPHAATLDVTWKGQGINAPDKGAWWQVVRQGAGFVELAWANQSGQTFTRQFVLDDKGYGLSVTDTLTNTASLPVQFVPQFSLSQADGDRPGELSSFVNYFGPMGVVGSGEEFRVVEEKYKNLKKQNASDRVTADGGWWGISSHFFMMAMVPGEGQTQRWFTHTSVDGRDWYTASVEQPALAVPAAGAEGAGTTRTSMRVYLGPKKDEYLAANGHNLSRAIDWGWFAAIAKPMHTALVWLHGYVGNWGLAIIALTVLLKIITFPLASKSYRAMAKMKKLAPEVEALKKRDGDNQQAMAQQLMALYAKEKVNPLSGCWPMLVQIPIFFAMYKVVLVSFEFRHAPLALWIHDLSAADPFFVLPVLMGISMWVQMQMQPPAADPVQQMVFKWMPVLFTVMFLWFPAGLVLYWLTNNVLSIGQQWMIMRGVEKGTTGPRDYGVTGKKG